MPHFITAAARRTTIDQRSSAKDYIHTRITSHWNKRHLDARALVLLFGMYDTQESEECEENSTLGLHGQATSPGMPRYVSHTAHEIQFTHVHIIRYRVAAASAVTRFKTLHHLLAGVGHTHTLSRALLYYDICMQIILNSEQ